MNNALTTDLTSACHCLTKGGLVIVPTETVYGVACDPTIPSALEKLRTAKGRDDGKPIARLVGSVQQVQATNWNDGLEALAQKYWPGSLTMVLETVGGWVGYRIPNHPIALELARQYGRELALTSANLSGQPDPKTATEAAHAIPSALVLDGGPSAEQAIPSTVVKIDGETLICLREGILPFAQIMETFNLGLL